MDQLKALVWLKWTLFRNSLRSRRVVASRMASMLVGMLAFSFSLLVAAGFGFSSYLLAGNAKPEVQKIALFGMVSFTYLMWATFTFSLGRGETFDQERLLLYPISFRRLFMVDLLTDFFNHYTIMTAPSLLAIAIGTGLREQRMMMSLIAGACAVVFGVAFVKLISTGLSALMRGGGRTKGETVVAMIGAVLGLGGALAGQMVPVVMRHGEYPSWMRWTPPGSFVSALSEDAGGSSYLIMIGTLIAWAALMILIAYRISLRSLLRAGSGGRRNRRAGTHVEKKSRAGLKVAGIAFLPAALSAVVEKELRYAARNAQFRALALMPLILTFTFRLVRMEREESDGAAIDVFTGAAPYMEGAQGASTVMYVFMIVSALACNLFAYEGSGMRTLVLAPVSRKVILLGKNIAVTFVALLFVAGVMLINELVFRETSLGMLLFTILCFTFSAASMGVIGNWLSVRYPKRLHFGKKMNASGMTGLLLIPVFIFLAFPPALALFGSYFAQSYSIKYVIMAAFAGVSIILYVLLLQKQGDFLAKHELAVLDVVSKREDE